MTSEQTKTPTCTEKGETTYTAEFDADWAETQTRVISDIPAKGHTLVHADEVPATEKQNGVKEHWKCSECGKLFADAGGEQEVSEEDLMIPRLKVFPFIDVSRNAWYYDEVDYAYQHGLFGGMSENTFEPETAMTRGMLVTVLWRLEGEKAAGENSFSDVPDDEWYTKAVSWAAENNIVNGVGNNLFAPEAAVTREQMATILYRFAGWKRVGTEKQADLSSFPDAEKVSKDWALKPMKWAVAEGLINGSDGCLLPQDSATRAQTAAVLMRFIKNIAE